MLCASIPYTCIRKRADTWPPISLPATAIKPDCPQSCIYNGRYLSKIVLVTASDRNRLCTYQHAEVSMYVAADKSQILPSLIKTHAPLTGWHVGTRVPGESAPDWPELAGRECCVITEGMVAGGVLRGTMAGSLRGIKSTKN